MNMSRRHWRNRGIKACRVPQTNVLVTGGKDRGDAAHRAAVKNGPVQLAFFDFLPRILLRLHLATSVNLGTCDVAVHVHAAGHHHHCLGIDRPHVVSRGRFWCFDYLACSDPDILALAVDTVCRIVDRPSCKFDVVQLSRLQGA